MVGSCTGSSHTMAMFGAYSPPPFAKPAPRQRWGSESKWLAKRKRPPRQEGVERCASHVQESFRVSRPEVNPPCLPPSPGT